MRAVTRLFQTGITNCPASIGLANATTSRKSSMAEVPPGLFGSEPGNIGSYGRAVSNTVQPLGVSVRVCP